MRVGLGVDRAILSPLAAAQATAAKWVARPDVRAALAVRRLPSGLALYLAAKWCSAQIKVLPNGLTTAEGRNMLELLPLCVVPAALLARGGRVQRIAWLTGGTLTLTVYLWAFVSGGWVP